MTAPFTRLGFQIPNFTFPDVPDAARDALLARRGLDWKTLPEAMREGISLALVLGDPDTVGEFVQRKVVEAGLDGLVVNLPADGHELEPIALAGEVLGKVLPGAGGR